MAALEAAFAQIVQEHAHRNALLKEQTEKAKKEALAVAAELPKLLMQTVNGGVQEVFANEKQIEVEARAVAVTVHKYIKQSNQWLSLFHNFDSALKEIGDFENWIKVMEYDCECITHALNRVVESTKSQ